MSSWIERDRKVLWHPFTQHELWESEDFPVIVSGEGVYLFDADGNKYLAGVSSLWLNVHGHRRPEIDAAVKAQMGKIAHSTFLGLSHPPGIELAALAPRPYGSIGYPQVLSSHISREPSLAHIRIPYRPGCQSEKLHP